MQRPASPLARVHWAVLSAPVGAVLLFVASLRAGDVPRQARDDSGAPIRAHGGSMSHAVTDPASYRRMAAQSRMEGRPGSRASALVRRGGPRS